jgi:hypothetical protein
MTDIMIDPATGLPALPEGQFWRVIEKTVQAFSGTEKAKYEIQLLETQPDAQETKYRYEPYHWSFNWLDKLWGGDGRAVPYTKAIKVWPLTIARLEIKTVDTGATPTLTPASIKAAAEELLKIRAREKQVASLLGDYPPKTIVNDTED